jgi:hypothetical protein
MTWKKVNNADAGDADHFGGDDLDKVSDLLSGVNVDTVDLNSTTKLRKGKLRLRNTANTFETTLDGSDVTVDNTVTLPNATTTLLGTDNTATVTGKTINVDDATNVIKGQTPTDANYMRDNGTKFVSSPIIYTDLPRAVFSNTNDIFYRSRNSANDTNPIASYVQPTNGFSNQQAFLTIEDLIEDFTTDNWVDVGATALFGVVPSAYPAGKLSVRCIGDNTNYSSSLDVTSMSDSVWYMRFRMRITAIPDTGLGGRFYFGMSDLPSSTSSNTSQDFMGLHIKEYVGNVGGNIQYTVHSAEADGSAIQDTGDTSQNFIFNANEWYYWDMTRTSTTNYEIRSFGKDKDFVRQTGSTMSVTIPSSIQTLRYIKACNKVQSLAGDRSLDIDEIRLWKTSARSTVVGSLASPVKACNSTINNTNYWRHRKQKDYSEVPYVILGPYQPIIVDDFKRYTTQEEADYHWVPQDTSKLRVNISTDLIAGTVVKDGTNDSITNTLNFGSLGTGNWQISFKIRVANRSATTSSYAQMFIGLFDTNGATATSVGGDSIFMSISANNVATYWNFSQTDGAVLNEIAIGGNVMTQNTDYYVRFTRVSTIAVAYGVYSDSNFTIPVASGVSSYATVLTTTGLAHLGIKINNNASTSDSTFTFTLEQISLVNATSATFNPPITGNTTLTSVTPHDPIAQAINVNKARTTETQIKFRINRNGNPFFTDSDTIRTINISDFTDQVTRYVPHNKVIPVLETDPYNVYWIQIIGVTADSDLAINANWRMIYDSTIPAATTYKMLNTHLHYLFRKLFVDNQLDAN